MEPHEVANKLNKPATEEPKLFINEEPKAQPKPHRRISEAVADFVRGHERDTEEQKLYADDFDAPNEEQTPPKNYTWMDGANAAGKRFGHRCAVKIQRALKS